MKKSLLLLGFSRNLLSGIVKCLMMCFLVFGVCFAGSRNRETPKIATIRTALDSTAYTYGDSSFNFSYGEDIRVVCKVDDSSQVRFGDDSLNYEWGYQIGTLVKDSNTVRNNRGHIDTSWGIYYFVVDTMSADSQGVTRRATHASDGSLTTTAWGQASDTSSVSGYVVQDRWFIPKWGEVIRFWAKSLGNPNKIGTLEGPYFEMHRRTGINMDAD